SSSSKSVGTMPVDVHCTMRKYSRINWGYYIWNADLVVLVRVDRAEPVCVHFTQRQVSDPTPVTQVGTRTMFLYFYCPAQWISSVFPLTTDVSAPIRSSRFITYLLASSLPLASLPSPSSPPWSVYITVKLISIIKHTFSFYHQHLSYVLFPCEGQCKT